jgi:hypothetical protein
MMRRLCRRDEEGYKVEPPSCETNITQVAYSGRLGGICVYGYVHSWRRCQRATPMSQGCVATGGVTLGRQPWCVWKRMKDPISIHEWVLLSLFIRLARLDVPYVGVLDCFLRQVSSGWFECVQVNHVMRERHVLACWAPHPRMPGSIPGSPPAVGWQAGAICISPPRECKVLGYPVSPIVRDSETETCYATRCTAGACD